MQEIFVGQKDLFTKKLNTDFEILIRTIEQKRLELQSKIATSYDGHIDKAQNLQEGLTGLKETINDLRQTEIKIDTEYLLINKELKRKLREVEKLMDFEISGNELDLLSSRFINDPFLKIERTLDKLDFFPVPQTKLSGLTEMFARSRILTPEHITVNFLTEIIPTGLKSVRLLYQHSHEESIVRQEYARWEILQKQALD